MSAGAAAAAAAIAKAIKASGVIVHVEPDDFVGILERQPGRSWFTPSAGSGAPTTST